ncbi:MAG: acetyltransferase [Pseudomonadota bacterium]|nr:acetyltransferase [Pseudomonadota bacterium]
MKRLAIFGIGEIAEVAHYLFCEDSDYDVSAFTVDDEHRDRETHLGLPVVPFEELEESYSPDDFSLFVAIGYTRVNKLRTNKVAQARAKGFDLASYTSSRAWVWRGYEARANTMVMEQNTIQPYVTIGENCTLWSGNHVGHHTQIGNNVFIASHAVISGSVNIGDNCFIGVNATLRDNITLGAGCVVGAGALLVRDAADKSVFPGAATKPSKISSDRLRNI